MSDAKKTVLVVLATGFEEIEAFTPVDVLRRMGVKVIVAGLDSLNITGSHGINVKTECSLVNVDLADVDMIVLPGGMPGAQHLRDSDLLIDAVKKVASAGGYVAAICAAPIALGRAGLINGKTVTAYPSFEVMLEGANYTGNLTEVDDKVITGKGPGASWAFTRLLAEALGKGRELKEIYELMLVSE